MTTGGHGLNNFLKLGATVNIFALIAGFAFGKTHTGIDPAQILSIHLYDNAEAPAEVLHAATDEASRLFRAAQVRISWECPSTESPQDQGTDMSSPTAVQQPDTRRYLVVRLIRRTPANVLPGALGYALPFGHKGAHVLIFYDRVETFTHSVNGEAYIILGHAIAHEIGHVLLGSSEHASGGLMQARWSAATWHLASAGLLAFGREEAERMTTGLRRFQVSRPLPVQESTLASSGQRRSPE